MRPRRGSSQKATDPRPSKKLKCEKKNPGKLEAQRDDDHRASASHRLRSGEPADKSSNKDNPHNRTMMLQSEGKLEHKMDAEMPAAEQPSLCIQPLASDLDVSFLKSDSGAHFQPHIQNVEEEEEEEEEEKEEEESGGAGLSDDSEMEPEEAENLSLELDNSAFLNEDSNQPLPVDRFFGSVAFVQDPPPAPLTRPTPSRREFRKAHFIAKDDDDEEEEEEVI